MTLESKVFYKPGVQFLKTIKKKSNSLLKPYFVVAITWASIEVIFGDAAPIETYLGVFYATGPTIDFTPLWYLPNLFALYCAARFFESSGLMSKESPLRSLVITSTTFLIGLFFLRSFWRTPAPFPLPIADGSQWQGLPFSIDLVPLTMLYFSLGFFCSGHISSISGSKIAMACAVIFAYTHWKYDYLIDLNYRIYTNWIACTIQAICGIVIVLNFARLLEKFRGTGAILAYIGSNSLFILMFHWPLQRRAYFILRDGGVDRLDHIAAWSSFLIAILGSLALSEAVRKTTAGRALFL